MSCGLGLVFAIGMMPVEDLDALLQRYNFLPRDMNSM